MKTLRSQIDARLGSVALERATRRRCERGTPPMAKGGTPTSVRRLNAAALNAAENSRAKMSLLIILETRKTT